MKARHRRLALVLAVAAVELGVIGGAAGTGMSPAVAGPASTGSGAPTTGSADAGSAIAEAGVAGLSPVVGGTTLAVSIGAATSSYQADEARASSQTVNLGGLGVILANTPFCGNIALPASRQPQPLVADSEGKSGTATNGETGVGAESVSADETPESASATAEPSGVTIPDLLDIGGTATSSVGYAAGERSASARATLDLTVGSGLASVELQGLTWTADQQTGAHAASSASFSLGSIKVGPATLPSATTAQLATALAAANRVLTTLGLTITMPTEQRVASTGNVAVTPLQLSISKSALTDPVVDPLLGRFAAVEAALNGQTLSGSVCSNLRVLLGNVANNAETVAGLAVGTFSSSGALLVDLGGASAETAKPPAYKNPFGSPGGRPGSTTPPTTTPTGSFGTGTPSTSTFGSPGGSSAPAGAGSTASASAPASEVHPSSPGTSAPRRAELAASPVHCETTSPARTPGCSSGVATLVGGSVAVLGAGLLLVDFAYGRRRRRLPVGRPR